VTWFQRFAEKALLSRLSAAVVRLDAMPLDARTFAQWREARGAVVECESLVREIVRLADWSKSTDATLDGASQPCLMCGHDVPSSDIQRRSD